MKKNLSITIAIITVFAIMGFGLATQAASMMSVPTAQAEFKMMNRKLWEDHITWTRMVIIGIVDNVSGTDKATERLLKNYTDMEDLLRPFYGNDAAEKFGDLMKDHLVIAADFVKAATAGQSDQATELEKKWYKNAEDIADFLSQANPKSWPKKTVLALLNDHLKHTKAEAVARITKDYDADIKAYDMIHDQALVMSDAISDGLIKQFPEKIAKMKKDMDNAKMKAEKAKSKLPIIKKSNNTAKGNFLVAVNGMTLYTFKNDEMNKSNCSGQCAINWPPFTTTRELIPGEGVNGEIKTIKRDDGTMQVTYKGMPLYFWKNDKVPGHASGDGVNNVWFFVMP